MYLIGLTNNAMAGISGSWCDKGPVRDRIEVYPALAGSLHLVEPAHAKLIELGARITTSPNAEKLAELTEESSTHDARFDRALRGGLGIMNVAAGLVATPAQRAAIEADRDELYPEGAAQTNATYGGESGSVAALREKLAKNPKLVRRATRIKLVIEFAKGPAQTYTVANLLDEQIEAGTALGVSEQARRELESGAPLANANTTQSSELSRARTKWIRAVNSFVDAANQLDNLAEEDRRAFFGALAKALDSVTPPNEAGDDEGDGDDRKNPSGDNKLSTETKK